MTCKNQFQKSCLRAYNDDVQTVTTSPYTVTVIGIKCVDTGISIGSSPDGKTVMLCRSGLYHVSLDLDLDVTTAGTITVQIYIDGIAAPCAASTITGAAASTIGTHVETELCVGPICPGNARRITFVLSGAEGTVTHTSVGVVKIA